MIENPPSFKDFDKTTNRPFMLVHTFEDPVYLFSWMVCFGGELNEAIKEYATRCRGIPWTVEPGRRNGHFAAYTDRKCGLLWFRHKRPAAHVVAHEAYHATFFAMQFHEVPAIEATEEVFAYYLEYLVKTIMLFRGGKGYATTYRSSLIRLESSNVGEIQADEGRIHDVGSSPDAERPCEH